MIDQELPSLLQTYRAFHEAPELSTKEEKTSATLAAQLRALGYKVEERVGRYEEPGTTCYGVVAMLKNGDGPVVLVRADMDALPIEEETSLPYASRAHGVMHACGHDVHMTTLIGTASVLARTKDRWRGTVMLVGQPAEEMTKGAAAMLRDRLYERFARPDYAIAMHDNASLPAGVVGYCPGYFMAAADAMNIRVRGVSGHGAAPHTTKDPVVLASQIVIGLQTIVSREISPIDSAVITVGSIHGGTKRNIIPDEVQLQMTARTYKPKVRERVLASIERIVRGMAAAAGVPAARAPGIAHLKDPSGPAPDNDPALPEPRAAALERELGKEQVVKIDPLAVSEDFGLFGLDRAIPACMLNVGAVDPARIAAGTPLPSLHSSKFAPEPEATIRGGVEGMVACVLELLR